MHLSCFPLNDGGLSNHFSSILSFQNRLFPPEACQQLKKQRVKAEMLGCFLAQSHNSVDRWIDGEDYVDLRTARKMGTKADMEKRRRERQKRK